jgi:hypothetical protein
MIFFEGPWEKLQIFAYGIRRDCTLRWVIPENPTGWRWLAAKIGDWAERRDQLWRAKHVIKRKNPHERWSRRGQ